MSAIRVANAPCSWGVLEFELEGEAAGYAQVLDEMAEAGYEGTELGDWGFMPTDPAHLQDELAKRNLTMLGAFVPIALALEDRHEAGIAVAVKTAKLLAAVNDRAFIVLADENGSIPQRTQNAGRIQSGMGLSDTQWSTFATGAEKVAKAVRDETGLRIAFHHHCAGYIETPEEVAELLDRTDPELVGLCFDTGHYAFGGGDALEGLKKHADRIWHVHFKDCQGAIAQESRTEGLDYFASVRKGVFCELGQGIVDFPAIKAQLDGMGYEGWIVVEQDVLPGMGTPIESAKRNRKYLREIGL